MKHTPGPWTIEINPKTGCGQIIGQATADSSFGPIVAYIWDSNSDGELLPTERAANARLIAAAPELLECLMQSISTTEIRATAWQNACIVLDKIKGGIE